MEHRPLMATAQADIAEGALGEMALRWFTETQAPHLQHQGHFPVWFQGLIGRKDAEDQLRDKDLGCFLFRLSDKALGYILSYKGRDRCRHFVITQNRAGQFVVSGDTETHSSLTDLIEYYRSSPFEPFGEYLTSPCHELSRGDLYDEFKPGVSVKAVKDMWDQRIKQALEQPPALPLKSTRKPLVSSASFDKTFPPQAVPLVQKNLPPMKNDLNSPQHDHSPLHGQEAQLEQNTANGRNRPSLIGQGSLNVVIVGDESKSESLNSLAWTNSKTRNVTEPLSNPEPASGVVYSQLNLVDSRSKSLPLLIDSTDEPNTVNFASFSHTKLPPDPTKKATCHTYSLQGPPDPFRESARLNLPSSSSLDELSDNPLYQIAGSFCEPPNSERALRNHSQGNTVSAPAPITAPQLEEAIYAQVPQDPLPILYPTHSLNNQIPDQFSESSTSTSDSNTYETLEDLQPKHQGSNFGKKNDKWRRFFPRKKDAT